MKILPTIPTRPCNFVTCRIFMQFVIATKNYVESATVNLQLMFNGILWLKILNGYLILEPFLQHPGKLHIGFMFGESRFFFTVVMDGTEHHK